MTLKEIQEKRCDMFDERITNLSDEDEGLTILTRDDIKNVVKPFIRESMRLAAEWMGE